MLASIIVVVEAKTLDDAFACVSAAVMAEEECAEKVRYVGEPAPVVPVPRRPPFRSEVKETVR
jgi:hypothetical protein